MDTYLNRMYETLEEQMEAFYGDEDPTPPPTRRAVDELHERYCIAAGTAENHIGRPDEDEFWEKAQALWEQYEEANRRLQLVEAPY